MMGRFVFYCHGEIGGFYREGGNQKDSPEAVFLIYEISSFRL